MDAIIEKAQASNSLRKKKLIILSLLLLLIATITIIASAIYTQVFISFFSRPLYTIVNLEKTLTTKPPAKPFNYPQNIAEARLKIFLTSVMKEEYLPPSFTVTHQLDTFGTNKDTAYTFGILWQVSQQSFHAFFHFNPNSSNERETEVYTSIQDIRTPMADLLRKYFKNVPDVSCKVFTPGVNTCSNFQSSGDIHKEFTAIAANTASASATFLFSCEIPTKESDWKNRKSCVDQFAISGL